MKVTSSKELETYIYSSVVLPLKGLNLPELHSPTPLTDDAGIAWYFMLKRTPIRPSYRRNYQREIANAKRNYWITFGSRGMPSQVIGEYNIKNHWVKLWEKPFRDINAMPIFSKLWNTLDNNTPFTKIIVITGNSMPVIPNRRPMPWDEEPVSDWGEPDESVDDDIT